MSADIGDLDVRPILAGGSDPFAEIMAAVAALAPDQGLRIVAPFRPAPLIQVLGSKGFSHQERALLGGDWEITFHPRAAPAVAATAAATSSASGERYGFGFTSMMKGAPLELTRKSTRA